jgi:hypothetical protein
MKGNETELKKMKIDRISNEEQKGDEMNKKE